jgi:hypothetical protein
MSGLPLSVALAKKFDTLGSISTRAGSKSFGVDSTAPVKWLPTN